MRRCRLRTALLCLDFQLISSCTRAPPPSRARGVLSGSKSASTSAGALAASSSASHRGRGGWSSTVAASAAAAAAAATAYVSFSERDEATAVRRVATATRFIVPALATWKAHEARSSVWLDEEAEQRAASAALTSIAEQLRALALTLGGIYVKGGQHICAQPSLPPELVRVLRTLMSDAKREPDSLAADSLTFAEDTGLQLAMAFASFSSEPVATASLANVYAATLPDGRRVAVKIQQRTVARFLAVDLWTIEQFYALLSFLVPNLRLGWLADETRRHMGEELDFVAERLNALEAAAMLAPEFPPSMLVIPATHAHLCGRRVLTMSWVDGVRLDDQPGLEAQGTDKRAVAALLQRLFASMIFLHGFVHCDPHPGNLLVTPTGQLAVLDHGIYRRLSDELRTSYAQLWLAVLSGSPDAIRARTAALGVDPSHWRFISLIVALSPGEAADSLLTGDGGERAMAALSLEERAETARRLLALTGGVAAQSQLFESLPPDLLLILKANNLLRHANEALGSPVNRFRVALPYASRGAGVRPSLRARLGVCLAPLAARMERAWRRRANSSV